MTPRLDRAVDRGLRARHQLLDVGVVGRLARSDDRHRRVVDDRVALREEQQVRGAADRRVAIGGAGDLAGVGRIGELARIRPEQRRQRSLRRRPARRRDDRGRELDAVAALVGDELLLDALELRRRIGVRREGPARAGLEVAHVDVRRIGAGLVARQDLRAVVRQHADHGLVRAAGGLEQALALERGEVEPIDERPRAFRRGADAGEEDRVGVLLDGRHTGGAAHAAAACPDCRTSLPGCGPTACAAWRPALSITQVRVHRRPRSFSVNSTAPPSVHDDVAEAILGARHLGGRGRERRAHRHHLVAMRHLGLGVAVVERLRPHHGRRRERLPLEAARSRHHAAVRHVVGHRQLRDLLHRARPGDPTPRCSPGNSGTARATNTDAARGGRG